MIENIEQAKERFKRLVDFYKLNDPNNYDYDDRDLISMKLVLEEIERLNNIIEEARAYLETVETLATVDKVNIFSISKFKEILKGE